jgi:formamidopyrimidine-DNA glycosylase
MPELPDVEIFRRRLAHGGLNRPIDRVQVTDPSAVEGISRQRLGQRLRGHRLTSIDDGSRLVYDDQRRLGFIALTEDVSDYIAGHRLGPQVSARWSSLP